MIKIRVTAVALVFSVLLAACGGHTDEPAPSGPPTSKGSFKAVVSFGDSLSDVGTYAPATSLAGNGTAPYLGGKFTTNGAGGTVWVENLAMSLGIALTPAEVGFNGTSVKCPAASTPALATSCTAYGQGGSRITDPAGIGRNDDGSGALTVPVVRQIANHLTRFGNFKDSDLILVYAGNNDVLLNFGGFAYIALDAQDQVAAGTMTQAQATAATAAAQAAARQGVTQAAQDLATDVRTLILGKGGRYVAVMELSDIGDTPFGNLWPAALHAGLTDLSQVFNAALHAALDKEAVRFVPTYSLFKAAYQNPAAYGFVNNTTPACDETRIEAITGGAVTDGSSLFCNATAGAPYNGLRAGASTTTWQFADTLHPTTGGHKVISDVFTAQLRLFGWI